MNRVYLNIFNSVGDAEDLEGMQVCDLDAARSAAIDGIRSLLAAEVRTGRLNLNGRIEIADGDGRLLAAIRFADALDELVIPDSTVR